MTLVRWKPYRDFYNIHERFNRLLQNDFSKDMDSDNISASAWSPLTDIYETEKDYVFKLEVPGLSREDIQIEFKQDTLIVTGERKEETEVKKEDYHRIERCCGNFTRSFHIPQNIDEKKIEATMKDGILELKVPKQEEAQTKAIPIKIK